MKRLIDADKLIDDLSDLKRSPWANTPYASDQRKLGIIEALDMVQSIVRVDSQTVEAEPVRHAKLLNAHPYGECSNCGYLIDIRDEFNYCPNCGAMMDEEREEE